MIYLTGTSDLLRVVTSAAITTDVYASWVDLNGTTATPGRTNTAITTATTTTVVGAPAGSTYRTLKTLTVRNKGASPQTVTILHTDGTTVVEVTEAVLQANYTLHYHEMAGFWVTDNNGANVIVEQTNGIPAAINEDNIVVLASDVTNNNATANTIADVTGLGFSVTATETYKFHFLIWYTSAAGTTGSRWSVSGPGSPTRLAYRSQYSLTATSETTNSGLTAYDLPAASNATSPITTTGGNVAIIEGIITPSASGTLVARFASEISSSAIVAKAGSLCRWYRVL